MILSLQKWIERTDSSSQRRYILIICLGLVGMFTCFWIIVHHRLSVYENQLQLINKRKRDVELLIQRHLITQQHKEHISQLVKKDDHYKILQRFDDILQSNNMMQNKVNEPTTSSQEVLDNYIEWTLNIELTSLSMKKLVELLYAIEKEERMYTKHLEIDKTQSGKFMSVRLSIATLEPNTVPME